MVIRNLWLVRRVARSASRESQQQQPQQHTYIYTQHYHTSERASFSREAFSWRGARRACIDADDDDDELRDDDGAVSTSAHVRSLSLAPRCASLYGDHCKISDGTQCRRRGVWGRGSCDPRVLNPTRGCACAHQWRNESVH